MLKMFLWDLRAERSSHEESLSAPSCYFREGQSVGKPGVGDALSTREVLSVGQGSGVLLIVSVLHSISSGSGGD